MSYITILGHTMTPQEFLHRQQEMLYEEEFNELIQKNQEEKAKQLVQQEEKDRFLKLIRTLGDCQDEIGILEQMYKEQLINQEVTLRQLKQVKQDLSNLKIKESKTKRQLDDMVAKV